MLSPFVKAHLYDFTAQKVRSKGPKEIPKRIVYNRQCFFPFKAIVFLVFLTNHFLTFLRLKKFHAIKIKIVYKHITSILIKFKSLSAKNIHYCMINIKIIFKLF